jgi:hypothetical protein
MGERGRYVITVSCDEFDCKAKDIKVEFSGRTQSDARRVCKEAGWNFTTKKRGKGGGPYMYCPTCFELEKVAVQNRNAKRGRPIKNLNALFMQNKINEDEFVPPMPRSQHYYGRNR